jgi:Response regulator containing CheY-like receiver, AAA-type ATPase, and DNA-binding domains
MKTVLVIDDEKSVRDSLKMILEYEKYSVNFAGNGNDGIKEFKANLPDAVLLDIKMPGGIDGLETLREFGK